MQHQLGHPLHHNVLAVHGTQFAAGVSKLPHMVWELDCDQEVPIQIQSFESLEDGDVCQGDAERIGAEIEQPESSVPASGRVNLQRGDVVLREIEAFQRRPLKQIASYQQFLSSNSQFPNRSSMAEIFTVNLPEWGATATRLSEICWWTCTENAADVTMPTPHLTASIGETSSPGMRSLQPIAKPVRAAKDAELGFLTLGNTSLIAC